MKNKIEKLILNAANELNILLDHKLEIEQKSECKLYGQGGVLDSISLVTLIVKVEEKIEDEFKSSIILADEKAMSQRRSPFLTVGTLSAYIESLLNAEVVYG
ncbi:MAG: hypothetical protein A3E85_06040 [Gammaproteobacteria bacterium RIFCSPHIGHO2_12_FULL_45_12]|nr:MAG: hypothetical protein A3E85_06040 [Gammaproteobacteria bacterium RIFCSPHIGHO2_12_FULL_45_12]